jgi:hypothetical protein
MPEWRPGLRQGGVAPPNFDIKIDLRFGIIALVVLVIIGFALPKGLWAWSTLCILVGIGTLLLSMNDKTIRQIGLCLFLVALIFLGIGIGLVLR